MKTTTIVSKATLDDLKKELERRCIVKRVKYWEDRRGNKTDITQLSDEHLFTCQHVNRHYKSQEEICQR